MKRSISPDFASEAKRFDPFVPPSQYKQHNHQQQQQQMHIHQQQQMLAQQQMQVAAAAQQQQQQFQMHQQIQAVQQQQQQQYASNPTFFNQPSFFPMNSVNMSPFPNPTAPVMYNSSPSWNYMSTPPPFFTPTPSTAGNSAQPPLPPPELKAEKPPLPKDPEPALGMNNRNDFLMRLGVSPPNYTAPLLRPPGPVGGIRIRGVNALNGAMYNGFNGGPGGIRGPPPLRQPNLLSPNGGMNSYARNRRRNPHHFPGVNPHSFFPRGDPGHFGDFNEIPHFNEEEQPAGPEKLTIFLNDADNSPVQVNKKAKRKPMSSRYSRSKEWMREDAEAALALENEYSRASRRQMLILKFPDPDLNKYIVKKYSPFIETVHFQQPSTPRYCFVQLKEGADVPKVMETIREIPFGTGKIVAELKCQPSEDHVVSPEEIDPYTLYIGNLPTSISVKAVKTHFPNALRIDIGYAQRMRYTRYAFIRYNNFEEASKAYKHTVNALFESRSLIVRFRRQKGNIGLPGETKTNAPPREDREALPAGKMKPWEDADDEDYHEDEEAFLIDDIEEDDDDIIDQEEDELNTLSTNLLPFGPLSPKEEIGIEKNKEVTDKDTEVEDAQPADKEPQASERAAVASKNDNSEASTSKASTNVKALNATAIDSVESVEDCKANVLEKANELLQKTATAVSAHTVAVAAATERPRSESPDCICTDPPETARKIHLEPVKLEHNMDESSSDNEGINLLGTRVKEELTENPQGPPTPTMDDIYLDDYEYDDLDEEPEEEDDDWADTSLSTRTTNWEELRRRELNAKEDKPDLNKLVQISDTLSSAAKVLPMVANLEPKNEFEKLYTASQVHKISDTIGETDDLHDMFAEMNSDLDEDDDTQF